MGEQKLPNIKETEFKMPTQQVGDEGRSAMLPTLLAVVIVVLILILAGLYLWGKTMESDLPAAPQAVRPTAEENNEPESSNAEADTQALMTLSTSDELDLIENDIAGTNLETLGAELVTIENELSTYAQ